MIRTALITNVCSHYRKKLFELLDRKSDFNFFFFSDGSEQYREQNNSIALGTFKGRYLKGYRLFARFRFVPSLVSILFRNRYDVVIKCINGKIALPVTFVLAKALRIPFVLWTGMWMHPGSIFHRLTFPFVKEIYKRSDAIVVYGVHTKHYLSSLGIDAKKIFIGWNTVDNEVYNRKVTEKELEELRIRLHVADRKIVLYTGRMVPEKGIEYLIEALSMVCGTVPCSLVLIGKGHMADQLRELAKSSGVESVIFLGYIPNDELYRYYAIADVFVLPPITTKMFKEPWGLVINEAMNQGCPVVATDAVGASVGGLVEDCETGFVVPERNSKSMANAILKILMNPELALAMKKKSLKKIAHWTYERQAQGFLDAIEYSMLPSSRRH